MTSSKFRIPRVAAAALMLGGVACDGSKDGTDSSQGVNTSSARIRSVGRSVCEAEQRCNAADFSDSYTSVEDCTEQRTDTFPLAGQSGEDVRKCQDAILDLGVCEAHEECVEGELDDLECLDLYVTYVQLCEVFDTDGEGEVDSSFGRNHQLLRPFRIPR
jgi:hypothetical protein